jgi:hypothetical protein
MFDQVRMCWNAWLDETVFAPRYMSEQHATANDYPRNHPMYLSKEQALRPWTAIESHPLHRHWFMAFESWVISDKPGWFVRWLFNRPMKKVLAQPKIDLWSCQLVYYWQDETGIVWLCTNRLGYMKELAAREIQEAA